MKIARVFLAIVALVLGFAGAVSSKAVPDITNHGVIQNTSNEFTTLEHDVCDNNAAPGTQCTLTNASGSPAYKVTAHSQPLYRP